MTFQRTSLYALCLLLTGAAATASASAQTYPYQNPALSPAERAEDLLHRLSVEQKAKLMLNDSPAIPEFGIATYNWWSEALHGCARAGLATVFPQAIGMAASFDDVTLRQVFDAASDEQRIKYTQSRRKGEVARYQGLTVWTPNINIFRDPRWGRGQETYGEDPYLTTRMGLAAVAGLQGDPNARYDKLHACAKHFAVHSGPEYERHSFDAKDITLRDLAETYLYAFDEVVTKSGVKEVMCAYNSYEGVPCCGSNRLLIQILRNEWKFDGLVVSDCSAIRDFYDPKAHHTHADAATASADAVLNGTDLNCGGSYKKLPEAVKRGLIRESDLDVSVRRILKARFELGEMDPDSLVSWCQIPESRLASAENDALALDMARKSMVLLQNNNQALPLPRSQGDKGLTYAVIGPNVNDSLTLWGNYNGTPSHTVTVLEGIRKKLRPQDKLIYYKGSEWVAREVFHSRYNRCSTDRGNGFTVQYYNNVDRKGTPVAEQQLTAPFQLCTSGAIVFAPGVNLEDFSASYTTTLHADKTEEIIFDYFVCGRGDIIVNGDTLSSFKTGHGSRRYQKGLKVKAGKDYNIQICFAFLINDAQFNFDLGVKEPTEMAELLQNTVEADAYIYVGGISPQLEGEEMKVYFEGFKGGDRTDIELPAVQRETLQALHSTGKPVVFVNMSGSAIALEPETRSCDAILQAWYGGQEGGQAIADVLFGDYNPAGRLPITFYRNIAQLPAYGDYNMPGHTYRYMTGKPLFAFGHGLSYTTFKYGKAKLRTADSDKAIRRFTTADKLQLVVPVTNTGSRDGEEVVQVYIKKTTDKEGPRYTLRGFKRTAIAAGQTQNIAIELTEENFRVFNDNTGKMETTPGEYIIYYGGSSDSKKLQSLKVICQ